MSQPQNDLYGYKRPRIYLLFITIAVAFLLFPVNVLAMEKETPSLFKEGQKMLGGGIGLGAGLSGSYYFNPHWSVQGDTAFFIFGTYTDILLTYHSAWNDRWGWYAGGGVASMSLAGMNQPNVGPMLAFGLDYRFTDSIYATLGIFIPSVVLNISF